MKILLGNRNSRLVIGGADNLHTDLQKEIKEYLSVEVKGAHFMRKKGLRGWNGKHCFLKAHNTLATGFVPMIISALQEEHPTVKITIEDGRENIPEFLPKSLRNYELPMFTLAPHQQALVNSVIDNYIELPTGNVYYPSGIWKAATNSGKTAAFWGVVANAVNPKALLLVDTQELFEQHYEFYCAAFKRKSLGRIGKVGSKYVVEPDDFFTIAMVGTLNSRMTNDFKLQMFLESRNILGVDECHGFTSVEAINVITTVKSGCSVFMSGTPLDNSNPMSNYKLVGMAGKVLQSISKKYLMDNGYSMKPDIKVYLHQYNRPSQLTYNEEYDEYVLSSITRAELIADLIIDRPDKKILITFFERKHGKLMYDTLMDKYHLTDCDWTHGQDPHRADKIKKFIDGTIRVLFSSSIMQQGVNVSDINTIIYATGEKAPIALSQFMGRGERLDGVNKWFEWVDFYDLGKYTSKHSRERIRFYNSEHLTVNLMYDANKRNQPIYPYKTR